MHTDDAPNALTPVTRPAPTDRPILAELAGRWSPRAIDPERPVTRPQILTLLEAARWAPSSGNVQPWRYLVFDGTVPDALAQARDCLRPGNVWALRAPVLLISFVTRYWPDSSDVNPSALHDVGAASLSLVLQAVAEGLVAHQIAGFHRDRVRERFDIPDGVDPVAFIAIGHPGPVALLEEDRRARELAPRRRRPIHQTAFIGGWGGPGLGDA